MELYSEDHGQGQPVVLIHGYPLDGSSWEKQSAALLSEEALAANKNLAYSASSYSSVWAMPTWLTDFRPDIARITVPSLIVHGTADNILPIDSTGREFHKALPAAEYVEIDGAPHGMLWTHATEVNDILLSFLAK